MVMQEMLNLFHIQGHILIYAVVFLHCSFVEKNMCLVMIIQSLKAGKLTDTILRFGVLVVTAALQMIIQMNMLIRGEWQINVSKLPEEIKQYAQEIDEVFNENVPYGCCGGCL